MNVAQLINDFKKFTDSSGAINKAGVAETAKQFNASSQQIDRLFFKIETVKKLLLETKSPILLLHFIYGDIGHAEVVYGFEVKNGLPHFLVMDPLVGDYKKLTLDALQSRGNSIILLSPN